MADRLAVADAHAVFRRCRRPRSIERHPHHLLAALAGHRHVVDQQPVGGGHTFSDLANAFERGQTSLRYSYGGPPKPTATAEAPLKTQRVGKRPTLVFPDFDRTHHINTPSRSARSGADGRALRAREAARPRLAREWPLRSRSRERRPLGRMARTLCPARTSSTCLPSAEREATPGRRPATPASEASGRSRRPRSGAGLNGPARPGRSARCRRFRRPGMSPGRAVSGPHSVR